jgi:putative restriction endonuclease
MVRINMHEDAEIRLAAFQRVRELDVRHGGAIPWGAIDAGFPFAGERLHLCTRARGIFRPLRMAKGVLSLRTVIPREGRVRRYDDIASDEGFFEYRFMGENPQNAANQSLREAMEERSPLIYFHGVAPTLYRAIWPAFITDWNPAALTVRVVPGEVRNGVFTLPESLDARRYVVVEAKRRLHQDVFRQMVLDAYGGRCAVSGLPERRLLHAAHIMPDRDERGQPKVNNGIAMTVLHHSAYDLNLLGIDPDGKIHVNRELLEIHDGPTLEHALKGVHGAQIHLPEDRTKRPDRAFLSLRFDQFTNAA